MNRPLALAALLVFASPAHAETFCSCATDAGAPGAFKNAECRTLGVSRQRRVIHCEDFEAPAFSAPTGADSWTAACTAGGVSARGAGSRFAQVYGGTAAACGWAQGEVFQVGTSPCDLRIDDARPCGGGNCPCGDECEPAGWLAGDPLQAGANACVGIVRRDEFDDLVPGTTGPTAPLSGWNSLALLVQPGRTNGLFTGGPNPIGKAGTHTVVYSRLSAYPSNLPASGVLAFPWKHEQFGVRSGQNGGHLCDMWLGTANGFDPKAFPFAAMGFFWNESQSDCERARSGATYDVGSSADTQCTAQVALRYTASGAVYDRETDWPYGRVRALRCMVKGYGTPTTEVSVWVDDEKIVGIRNLDTRGARGSIDTFGLNAFANANQGGGETPTTSIAARYLDNVLLQAWTAAECAEDGAACGAPPTVAEVYAAGGATR